MFRINKLMWMFCKNECVKLKKYVFQCKIEGKFASPYVNALTVHDKPIQLVDEKIKKKRKPIGVVLRNEVLGLSSNIEAMIYVVRAHIESKISYNLANLISF